jgi:hypothetical protein
MESLMHSLHRALLSAVLVFPAMAQQPSAVFDSFNDWLGAEARGVRIEADGSLKLAPNLRRVAQLPEGVVWCVVPDGAGGAFISAGNEGKLFRFSGNQVKPLAQVKGGIVFAMARLGQDLIVAPSGENKLFRVTPSGEVKSFAEIDARLVWAMTAQGSDLYLAGGNEKGAVFLLAREGSSRKLAEQADETAFTSLLSDTQGGWYLGSHGHGLVMRYSGEHLETLAATGFEQVQTLAMQNGVIYIGADNGLAKRFTAGNLEKRESYLSSRSSGAKGAVIALDRNRVPATLWQSDQSQVFSMTLWNNQLLVGTGNRARIFSIPIDPKVRDLVPFAVLQDLGTAQATAFMSMGSDLLAVGSNPAELHVLSEAQATEGTIESQVLKGMPLADWGRAYVEADTPQSTNVDLQYRVGSTEAPDGTWSPWTPPLRSGERPNLQPTRFAQFRLKLTSSRGGTTPVVNVVRVHWANRNLAPQWESIDTMPPGLVITRSAPTDDIGIERIPLQTQKLIPALGYLGSEKRSFRRGAQAFAFKVSDPNGDQLNFRISLIPDKGNPILLESMWRERFFTFDSLPVPDGRYRLEVTATDAPSQPFNLALTSTWRTAAFTIDHTPPVISELTAIPEGDSIHIKFVARDEMSVLEEAAVSADGDGWLQIAPEDRVFDSKEERFDVLIPKDRVKGDRIIVKVMDANNNEQTAAITIGEIKKH